MTIYCGIIIQLIKSYLWKFIVVKASFKSPAITKVPFSFSAAASELLIIISGKPNPWNTRASGKTPAACSRDAHTTVTMHSILSNILRETVLDECRTSGKIKQLTSSYNCIIITCNCGLLVYLYNYYYSHV